MDLRRRLLDLYRAHVLLHERLVPYNRAAAATAQRSGLPIIRPLALADPTDVRRWSIADAYGSARRVGRAGAGGRCALRRTSTSPAATGSDLATGAGSARRR